MAFHSKSKFYCDNQNYTSSPSFPLTLPPTYCVCVSVCVWVGGCVHLVAQLCLTICDLMNDSLPWDRPLCPWDFPGKKPGVGCHSILQGIFSTQESNLHLLHYRQMFYHLSHLRWKSPYLLLLFPSSLQSEALFCSLNIIHKFLTQGSLYL